MGEEGGATSSALKLKTNTQDELKLSALIHKILAKSKEWFKTVNDLALLNSTAMMLMLSTVFRILFT